MSNLKRKPRILLIGGSSTRSGVPRHLTHLCKALKDRADITVLSDRNQGGFDEVQTLTVTHREISGLATTLSPLRSLRALLALRSEIQCGDYDLVWAHARLPVILTRVLWHTLPKPRPRLTVTFHGLPFTQGHHVVSRITSRALEHLMLRLGPRMDAIFLTEAQKNLYLKHVSRRDVEKLRPHVLNNCSDVGPLPQVRHRSKRTRLVMTGRVSYQKNLIAAARLFAHLPESYQLDLYGPGTDEPYLRESFARHLSATALTRVGFHGPTDDMAAVLAKADGYLLTSRYEGLPIGAIEAMEAGLPAILPKIEGTHSLLSQHPYSLGLNLTDFERDAVGAVSLMSRTQENGDAARREIRLAWAKSYSPEVWMCDLHRLVADLTIAPNVTNETTSLPNKAEPQRKFAIEGSIAS